MCLSLLIACLACFVCSSAQHTYVLTGSSAWRACVLMCLRPSRHRLSYLLYIWKVKFQIFFNRKKRLYSDKYLEPTWTPIEAFKGTLSGLRQFLATDHPLKIMKNSFYFTSKALFFLKIFKFLFWFFGHVAKRLD